MYKSTTKMWQPTLPSLFKISVLGSALVALGAMTGCSSNPSSKNLTTKQGLNSSGYLDADSLDSLEGLLSATDMRAVEGDRLLILKHGDVWKRMRVGFKMDTEVWNPRIDAQRSWFTSRQPYIDRLSARASRYLYHTVKEAERRGIPTELALLPVIESSYDPAATSSAAAAGLWQFIPSTGKIYGLRQTPLYDGRRDVVESTRAAYEFLGSLYNQFGSWELALAAYNAGPGRIQQAINRNKAAGLPTDYWSLKLPQETMNYVPRFIAVAQIIKSPDAYGVSLPPIANRPHFREVTVGEVSLNDVAAVTGLSRAEIYALNPGYRGDYIASDSPMKIIIPADLSPTIDAKLKKINSGSVALLAKTNPPSSNPTTYTGSTVSSTAKANTSGVTVTTSRQPVTASTTTTKTVAVSTANTANISVSASSKNTPEKTTSVKRGATPQGSSALANFASNSDIPSAPRIPVAVVQANNVKPIAVEPPLSAAEKKQILLAVEAEGSQQTVDQVLQPVASKAEQEQVVAEIQKIAPQGTEIVDPYDGKIKLTAIQTSLSVAEQQGKELTKGFAYPRSLAENNSNSDEAKRNHGKNTIQTDSEVVVVPPKGKRSLYKVVSGDTLAIIAAKNGVSWRDIANWNQIDPASTLFAGATLYLYDAQPQAEVVKEKSKPEIYVVQANDSLTGVAAQFGLSVSQLADFNGLSTTSNLLVGQKLSLKENTSDKPKVNTEKKSDKTTKKIATKTYVVKRGEYLKLIADRYALSLQELADLTPDLSPTSSLMVGQKINVPLSEVNDNSANNSPKKDAKAEPSIKVENYTVQRGDTLYDIASNYKISMSQLADLNDLTSTSNLQAGQKLKVPAQEDTAIKTPTNYTVQSGDTLSGIAVKYNISMDDISGLNDLSRNSNLMVGQKLKLVGEVPKSSGKNNSKDKNVKSEKETAQKSESSTAKKDSSNKKDTEKYVVKSGESLHVIAGRTGLSVAELAALNDLSPKAGLRVGQTILIPQTLTQYKVKRGDTLIGLASRYGMQSSELAELNGLRPNAQLKIGDMIKVPNL